MVPELVFADEWGKRRDAQQQAGIYNSICRERCVLLSAMFFVISRPAFLIVHRVSLPGGPAGGSDTAFPPRMLSIPRDRLHFSCSLSELKAPLPALGSRVLPVLTTYIQPAALSHISYWCSDPLISSCPHSSAPTRPDFSLCPWVDFLPPIRYQWVLSVTHQTAAGTVPPKVQIYSHHHFCFRSTSPGFKKKPWQIFIAWITLSNFIFPVL